MISVILSLYRRVYNLKTPRQWLSASLEMLIYSLAHKPLKFGLQFLFGGHRFHGFQLLFGKEV